MHERLIVLRSKIVAGHRRAARALERGAAHRELEAAFLQAMGLSEKAAAVRDTAAADLHDAIAHRERAAALEEAHAI
jgi:hypothetical protein